MTQLFKMAFRDLGRNRRRTFFSALAVAIGLALLMLMSSVINGEMGNAIQSAILLQSGHIQIRSATFDENQSSLKWEDLVVNPDQIVEQISALPQVKAASPRLFASGFLSTGDESTCVKIYGIDPDSAANEPYRMGLISGSFLTADDREGLLIGSPAADKLHLQVGDTV
jgi:ABC-type lipoprotein release transport system permease subunit